MAPKRSQLEREKVIIWHMVETYCRGQRHSASSICVDCCELLQYAYSLIEACPLVGSTKPVCGLCRSDCFISQMHRHFAQIRRHAGQ